VKSPRERSRRTIEIPGSGGSEAVVASSARIVRFPVEYARVRSVPCGMSASRDGVRLSRISGWNVPTNSEPRLSSSTRTTFDRRGSRSARMWRSVEPGVKEEASAARSASSRCSRRKSASAEFVRYNPS